MNTVASNPVATEDSERLYADYHAKCRFKNFGNSTFFGPQAMTAYPDASSVLDFGCGNGLAVARMREAGSQWFGLEYSQTAYDKYLKAPHFFVGSTQQFAAGQFDLAYSTEVLEHIPAEVINETIGDLCRVTSRYVFMTISLRPSSDNNRYHCTLRSRAWWETLFAQHDFIRDDEVVCRFQKVSLKSTKKILSKWAGLGPDCLAFAQNPPYELQGEEQFWFFAFRRRSVPAPARSLGRQPFYARSVVPKLRQWFGLDRPAAKAA